jgi:hypothetical protein
MTQVSALRVRKALIADHFQDYVEDSHESNSVSRYSGFSLRTREWVDGVRVIVTHRFGNDAEGRSYNGSRGVDDETRNRAVEKMVQQYADTLTDAGFTVENCGIYLVVV